MNSATKDQRFAIFVSPGADAGVKTKYAVNIYPPCLELSHTGSLTAELSLLVNDFKPEYLVDLEFIRSTTQSPYVAGPFVWRVGNTTRRGYYQSIFPNPKTPFSIPEVDVDPEVKSNWVGTFTIKIWDRDTGELLGEVDPGVKVIDDPGVVTPKTP